MSRRGIPIVISAASGTGKTSLCLQLLNSLSGVVRSISYTTRPPRGEEVDGRDYHFVSEKTFDEMIEAKRFVEWAQVFQHRYGTGFEGVQEQLSTRVDVLLDIDVQGGLQIRERFENSLLIFLLPPSMAELHRRLVNRNENAPDEIAQRLEEARQEIAFAEQYDYLIVNDDFDVAAQKLRYVIRARRIANNRKEKLIGQLLGENTEDLMG